jgi:hypothetical protein
VDLPRALPLFKHAPGKLRKDSRPEPATIKDVSSRLAARKPEWPKPSLVKWDGFDRHPALTYFSILEEAILRCGDERRAQCCE